MHTLLLLSFQASSISNAYTVKSLPGAYLYIPLLASAAGGDGGGRSGEGGVIYGGAGGGGGGRVVGAGAGSVVSVSSLTSVRRSLSDPEISFAPPFGHPIILTVNPSSDNMGNNISIKYTKSNIKINIILNIVVNFIEKTFPKSD